MTEKCHTCGEKPRHGKTSYCRDCGKRHAHDRYVRNAEEAKRKAKEYRDANIDAIRAYDRRRDKETGSRTKPETKARQRKEAPAKYRALRKEVLDVYGGKCVCCGESTYEFLAIDHKNNDGAKERREGQNRIGILYQIRRDNFPDRYQVLCHNCNLAKGFYGACPHAAVVT